MIAPTVLRTVGELGPVSGWISTAWRSVSPHLEAFGALAAAVLALIALVLEARRRRLEQFLRLTAVSAWGEPVGPKATVEEGAQLTVRNDTGQALQQAKVYIWPRDTKPPAVPPGGTRWAISTFPVPLVPPHDTRTFPIPGAAFRGWGDQMHHSHFLVAIAFQDARGRWWWRLANGRMTRRQPVKILQEPPSWGSPESLKPSWRLRWWLFRRTATAKLGRRFKRE